MTRHAIHTLLLALSLLFVSCDRSGPAVETSDSQRHAGCIDEEGSSPYRHTYRFIQERYSDVSRTRRQCFVEFREAGEGIDDVGAAIEVLSEVLTCPFASKVDYNPGGDTELPHVDHIRATSRFALAVLARSLDEKDWHNASFASDLTTRAVVDLFSLPTLVEQRVAMLLSREYFSLLADLPSEIELPSELRDSMMQSIDDVMSACLVGGRRAIEATYNRHLEELADPALMPDLHGVDRAAIRRDRDHIRQVVQTTFDLLADEWASDEPSVERMNTHLSAISNQHARPFVAGLDRLLRDRDSLAASTNSARRRLRRE